MIALFGVFGALLTYSIFATTPSTGPAPESTFIPSNAANTPKTIVAEDIDQNGRVDLVDFSLLAERYGKATDVGRADINRDGSVNALDFSQLATKF